MAPIIAESVVICEYLEERHPDPPVIGTTPEERAETRMWVRRIDQQYAQPLTTGFRAAEGLAMFKDRMRCLPEGATGLKALAGDGLALVDQQLARGPFVVGERLTLADIVLHCFVNFGRKVGQPPDPSLRHLAAWRSRMDAPSSSPGKIS